MERKIEIDILKGILIIFVIIGHLPGLHADVHRVIYWFHMPLFFMISGSFLGVSLARQVNERSFIKKQFQRYVVPFYAWSILLYLITRPEGIFKNLVRIIYAGRNNTTIYSYPFWFINTLFVAILFIFSIDCVKKKIDNTRNILNYKYLIYFFWGGGNSILAFSAYSSSV
jgi:fucose 4-O-acetylase-like acetyltransferase